MEERCGLGSISLCIAAVVLGLLSSLSCIASEFKRTKEGELKLDGKLCYLPGSSAFRYGVAALAFLCAAQVIGTFVFVTASCSKKKKRLKDDERWGMVTTGLSVVSWVSFLIAVALISAATSMNREQRYGKGWLNGDCYTVKDGVYIGSAVLALVAICCILGSASSIRTSSKRPVEQDRVNGRHASER